jgi:hypothetical protein
MSKKLIKYSFFSALGQVVYILLVVSFMMNASRIFGQQDKGILPGLTFLLLFVFSAALSGALILGKPVLLYLDGEKKDAITLFGLILGWIMIFLIIALVAAAILA